MFETEFTPDQSNTTNSNMMN